MNEIIKKRVEIASDEYSNKKFWEEEDYYARECMDIIAPPAFAEGAKFAIDNLWISVDEALPNPMEEVVAIDENENTSLAWVSASRTWVVNKTNCISDVAFDYGKITHWMPIPKLKKDE